ncbi:hypothetical protein DB88DRAFT_72775 [Papiliotrema laurentii]|uniref:Uncharacterized protein n=1 Tax=Papiliotrema laurentii TaxID=5418 RepID=A0AAD9CWC2_PAPLA|nr:hypothetical protein DB88DRAFT_72775 [Papiliotrema laurentii]
MSDAKSTTWAGPTPSLIQQQDRGSSSRASVAEALRSLAYSPRAIDEATDMLCDYIVGKKSKGRSESNIMRRLDEIQSSTPSQLRHAFFLAKYHCDFPLPPNSRSGSSGTRSKTHRRTSTGSTASLETLLTPKSSHPPSTPGSSMTSSCVPQPSCAGLPVFVVTPPPDSNDTSGAPISPIWSIDDFGFEPFSLDPLFLSTPPQRHSARRQGESKEEVDQITLDSFPLPPEHLPYQCPPPRNAARPIPDVPDEVASLPALSPSASSNLSEEWPGGEEDDDDSNTITASFMSSMNSWIGIVNAFDGDDEDVFGSDGLSRAERVQQEYVMGKSADPSSTWPERCGIAL